MRAQLIELTPEAQPVAKAVIVELSLRGLAIVEIAFDRSAWTFFSRRCRHLPLLHRRDAAMWKRMKMSVCGCARQRHR